MSRKVYLMDTMHPLMQIVLLASFSLMLMVVFMLGSMYLVRPLFGITTIDLVTQSAIDDPAGLAKNANELNALKFIQLMTSFGLFLLPALAFAKLKFPEGDWLKLNTYTPFVLLVLGILILIASTPFIDLMYELNQKVNLPGWMKTAEHNDEQITKAFLKTIRPADLWINLVVIAIIPALGEELMFRGCLQQIMKEWTKDSHAAIWITAFIFSFIHFQFFGFFPRLLLGALLGYLFVWSGSLWVPIAAHAFNNGAQVVLVYLHDHNMIGFNIESEEELPIYITIVVTLCGIGMLWLFRTIGDRKRFIY